MDYPELRIIPGLQTFARYLVWTVFHVYNRLSVEGIANVPATGPVILAPNHTSYLDPPLVGGCFLHRQGWYMGKQELFRVPIFGPLLSRLGAFPVTQDSADRRAIRLAVEVLRRGDMLTMFPEGRRSLDGTLLPPQRGISLVARMAPAPVVPVYIQGARQALTPGSPVWRPAKIRMRFGTLMRYDEVASGCAPDEDPATVFANMVMDQIRQMASDMTRREAS